MYAERNPKTKKALKEMVMGNPDKGIPARIVYVYQPNDMGFGGPTFSTVNGVECADVTIEGPHYPAAHSWYARAKINRDMAIIPGTIK